MRAFLGREGRGRGTQKGDPSPDPKLPFAIETTIRQLDRYCTWWTRANGFFSGAASDLSLPAAELSKALRTAWMERIAG